MNLARLGEIFQENFSLRGELGASVSVWRDGVEILSLAAGFCDRQKMKPWTASTPVLFWSATKGPSAACVLHCMQEKGVSLSNRVADVWPEFARAGKERITLGELLSHRAGLAALSSDVSIFDYDAVIDALVQEPPIEGQAYHPRTFGFLLDEIVRRLSGGIPLKEYWRSRFAEPWKLDLWIGLPDDEHGKISPVHPPRANAIPRDAPFYRAFSEPDSLTARAFASPHGLPGVASMNTAEARAASFPAFGGIGTASALGGFYSMLATANPLFTRQTLDWMSTTLGSGFDRVLHMDIAFSAGFMKSPRLFGPSPRAFGHPGAGGSIAFADPDSRLAFAYVMNQMEPGVLPGEKSLRLIDALYE